MIDPIIESHLWMLLTHHQREGVTIEDVCWFHGGRGLRAIQQAFLTANGNGLFVPTDDTARWVDRVFREIRRDHTAACDLVGPCRNDYEPDPAAQEALPALAHREAAGAALEDPFGEPTPTEPQRIAG